MEVSEPCGKKRRETSRTSSTKRLTQCVRSILSISNAGPPVHSFVVVCSYLPQPYLRSLRTVVAVGVLYISALVFCTYMSWCLNNSEIVLSTRYGKTMVFINKTLSTETTYQRDLINRDLLSTSLIVSKVGSGMWCGKFNSTSNEFFFLEKKISQIFIVWHTVTGGTTGGHIIQESGLSLSVSGYVRGRG